MDDRESTIRSRELGDALRVAMTRAGLTGRDTARSLGWSCSRISRLLSGKRGVTPVDVSAFLAVCRVTGTEREHLLRLCDRLDASAWLQRHGSRLPKQLRTLIDHENKAVTYTDFQPIVVPGLLQTADYARALIRRVVNVPDDEVEDRVAARMARQDLFSGLRHPQFSFCVHECVLRMPVGGPEVMSEQLHHLLRMSVRSYVTLQVIPTASGAHAGVAGPFILMEFEQYRPVIYLDSETSCLFLEDPAEITAYRRIREDLAATALDEGESRDLIARLAIELYAEGDAEDDTVAGAEERLA